MNSVYRIIILSSIEVVKQCTELKRNTDKKTGHGS